jgi:hypothetical protein
MRTITIDDETARRAQAALTERAITLRQLASGRQNREQSDDLRRNADRYENAANEIKKALEASCTRS